MSQQNKSGVSIQQKQSVNNKINSEPAFQQVIDSVRNYIVGYNPDGLPRFGILSIIAKRTPFFAYDHPQLTKLADTAFTDFHHCFFCNDFTKENLLMDRKAKQEGRREANLLFVALHELSHVARLHNLRMKQFNPTLANIAGDIRINMDLLKFPELYISDELAENSWGCSQEELDKWEVESEEVIAYQMLAEAKKQQNNNKNKNNKNNGNGQQVKAGGSHNADQDNRTKQEKIKDLVDSLKNGAPIKLSPGDKVGAEDNHMIDIKDVIEALEKAGLQNVIDKLKLPSSGDDQAIKDLHQKANNNIINDDAELNMIRNDSFNGARMPGEHINSAVSEHIKVMNQPKVTWKTAVKEIVQGGGLEYQYSDEVQHDLCYVDPASMGISDELYLGVEIPHERQKGTLINIMDTSGSVTFDELKDYCSEIFGQMDSMNDDNGASEVIFMSADTVQRGEIVTLTKDNYEDYIHDILIYGRGGTEFEKPLNSAFDWANENDKKIDGIIYWTDLGATPPSREALPETLPPIIFMTHAKHFNSSFKESVSEFADVYAIDENLLLDFEQLSEDIPDAVTDYDASTLTMQS